MLALLGSALGFGTSIIPEILGFFKQKQANEQELAMLEAKAAYAEKINELDLKKLDAQADIKETESIYSHDQSLDAGPFVNALRGSVRPVITYLFVLMYIGVKCVMIYALITNQNIDWTTAIQTSFNDEDSAILATIISFWFGSRAFSKAKAWQHNKG
ncbi:MAG: hypothetical protein VW683_03975 [Betaproteobacteria bacterium]